MEWNDRGMSKEMSWKSMQSMHQLLNYQFDLLLQPQLVAKKLLFYFLVEKHIVGYTQFTL